MPRTSTRRWKGCQLCKPHKNASHGDSERMPWTVARKFGKKRRASRKDIPDD
jgi:hypothetical protein